LSEQNYNNQVGRFGDSGPSHHMGVNRWVFTRELISDTCYYPRNLDTSPNTGARISSNI